jgi:hypothetical protein
MPTVEEIIRDQVSLETSCVDRVYINGYIPTLMQPGQLVNFLRKHLGYQIPSPAILQKIHNDFVKRVEAFAQGGADSRGVFPEGSEERRGSRLVSSTI